jgi:hypothetical protein
MLEWATLVADSTLLCVLFMFSRLLDFIVCHLFDQHIAWLVSINGDSVLRNMVESKCIIALFFVFTSLGC